jgi:hypothetical protein
MFFFNPRASCSMLIGEESHPNRLRRKRYPAIPQRAIFSGSARMPGRNEPRECESIPLSAQAGRPVPDPKKLKFSLLPGHKPVPS